MIHLNVHVSGGCKVLPGSYDSIEALEQAVKAAVENALSFHGNDISVAVAVSL